MADAVTLNQQVRELRVKATFDRISAAFFLLLGVILSVMIYAQKIHGYEMDIVRHNPLMLALLVVPILPAIFLERRLGKTRKKIAKLRAQHLAAAAAVPPSPPPSEAETH